MYNMNIYIIINDLRNNFTMLLSRNCTSMKDETDFSNWKA